MTKFNHLHLHTAYSMLDGTIRIKDLFSRCGELGMDAVAITDHGNMYGVLEFVKTAVHYTDEKADVFDFLSSGRQFKVKPIIGCEVYITEDMHLKSSENKSYNHLILLCKNRTGYENLIKLVSFAFTEGMYYKPRIDFSLLEKHCEGLICLSACLSGQIPKCLLKGDIKGADEWAKKYKALFKDDFYIELMDHRLMSQRRVLPLLRDVALRNNIKMVATNDAHYLNKEDALMQKVLQNVSFGGTMSPEEGFKEGLIEDDESEFFPTDEFYVKSGDEMAQLFSEYEGAIENTLEIANKCSCDFFSKKKLLPNYFINGRQSTKQELAEFLRNLCFEGLRKKYKNLTDEIVKRAEEELEVIISLDYVEYFLIVWDFIHFSENNGVSVGPGRGSGVGSIVAYAIGITKVDPLKYSLIFERFLNKERVSNPDFDIDFCVEGREKVINYVVNTYGEENVSQIITFSTLAAKAAVKDVGRVFDRPYAEVDKLTKLMPKLMGKSKLQDVLGISESEDNVFVPELKDIYYNDATSRQILDMAMKIEGLPRQTGIHAAGVIICKDKIYEHIPIAMTGDGITTTQFNMGECEELGLLKMDFLGLTTLTDISKTLKYIREGKGIEIDLYNMEYNDPNVFSLISEGDTHAVFQLESEGMKRFMKDLKPTTFEDIIAGIALFRPGPMDKIGEYIRNKRNPELVKYDHFLLEPISKVTYGIMVYQEQVMEAVRVLAGYSLGRADIVRRIMGKKKASEMQKERQIFIYGTEDGSVKGCVKNGIEEKVANKIFDDMTSFASYAFNKSHAAAYAHLAYQTAYLKRYYTVEFITAVLNNRITKNDEISNYLMYLKEKNIPVLPPNINKSYSDYSPENGGVRIGLKGLKSVGESIVSVLISEREENGEYKSFEEFVKRMQTALSKAHKSSVNKKMLESLIFGGAFDCFNINRCQLISSYETILDRVKKDASAVSTGQISFFDEIVEDKFIYPSVAEYDNAYLLKKEKEVSGVYLSSHPLEEFREKLKEFSHNTLMLKNIEEENVKAHINIGGILVEATSRIAKSGKEFGIGLLEDLFGTVELLITGDKLSKYRHLFIKDRLVSISGRISVKDEESVAIWVDSITPFNDKKVDKMCIYVESKDILTQNLDEIKEILNDYQGDDELYFSYIENGKKVVSRFGNISVLACDTLRLELLGFTYILDVVINK